MQSLKAITRLYSIHIFAFLAVGISTYYPPWDIILSLLYLLVIGSEARSLRDFPPHSKWMVTFAWQAPGIVLFLLVISHTTIWDLSNYAYFIMLFWYTALVPILSLLPGVFWRGWPLYYYFLLALPFIMITYHFILSCNIRLTNK